MMNDFHPVEKRVMLLKICLQMVIGDIEGFQNDCRVSVFRAWACWKAKSSKRPLPSSSSPTMVWQTIFKFWQIIVYTTAQETTDVLLNQIGRVINLNVRQNFVYKVQALLTKRITFTTVTISQMVKKNSHMFFCKGFLTVGTLMIRIENSFHLFMLPCPWPA